MRPFPVNKNQTVDQGALLINYQPRSTIKFWFLHCCCPPWFAWVNVGGYHNSDDDDDQGGRG